MLLKKVMLIVVIMLVGILQSGCKLITDMALKKEFRVGWVGDRVENVEREKFVLERSSCYEW